MGWEFFIDPKRGKKDRIEAVINPQKAEDAVWGYVDHRVVGNNLWMVLRHKDSGVQEASLVRLESGAPMHGWGYTWASHHEESDLPLSLLLQLTPNDDAYEVAWREAVKRNHEEKSKLRKYAKAITVGSMFEWKDGRVVVKHAHPGNSVFGVAVEIQDADGLWVQSGLYNASRTELSKLPPFVASTARSSGEELSETQQALFA